MIRERFHNLWLRLKALLKRQRLDQDLADELEFHLAMREENLIKQGMSPGDAHDAARRGFGNMVSLKESSRNLWSFPSVESLAQDVRYGLRQLRRNSGFAVVAILTLALGIGVTTTIFTATNDFLLRSLPFRNSDRLVFLRGYSSKDARLWGIDPPGYRYLESQNDVFGEMAAWSENASDRDFNLTGPEGPERVAAMKVTANFFSVLGIKPVLGHSFSNAEDRPGGARVVLISHALWLSRYGGNPNVIGKMIVLDGNGYTLIGVLPANFRFSTASQSVWVPLQASPAGGYGGWYMSAVARLKPGVDLAQARADMDTLAERFDQQFPQWERNWRVLVETARARYVGHLRPALLALLGAAALVLLISCSNLANLLLTRGTRRYREIAIRRAVGASRTRIVRQMLIESSILAFLGGAGGLLMAFGGVSVFYSVLPADWHPLTPGGIDASVVLFAVLTSVLTVFLFGTVPAWTTTGFSLNEALKEGIRTPQGGNRSLRTASVATEVALATVLVAGTALLMESFVRLSASSMGFRPEHVLTVSLERTRGDVDGFYKEVLERTAALPAVRAAGAINIVPLSGLGWGQDIMIEGRPPLPRGHYIWAAHRSVTAGYFRAMGIPLLMGRSFEAGDQDKRVAVISDTMARDYWPGEDPIGKRFGVNCSNSTCTWNSVIGVVGDVKEDGATGAPTAAMYFDESFPSMTLVIRTAKDPTVLTAEVRDIVRSVDPNQPIGSISTMEGIVADSIAPQRLTTLTAALFAALALILAVIGVYGVISHSVAQRNHEFGVRMALGARPGDMLKLVIGQGLKLALLGVAIGIAGALALTRFLSSLLYGVKPTDPLAFVGASVVLMATALLACYIPARRATKVDPMVALHYE